MKRVARRWGLPLLTSGWSTWAAFAASRREALARARHALVRMAYVREQQAFESWRKVHVLRSVRRHREQGQPCVALAYWLKAKCLGGV